MRKYEYNNASISDRIEYLRVEKGYTIDELSEKLDISLDTLYKRKNSGYQKSRPWKIDELLKVCNLFNVDLDYLVGAIEKPTHEIKSVTELTGLNEEAIDILLESKMLNDELDNNIPLHGLLGTIGIPYVLDALICSSELEEIVEKLITEIRVQKTIRKADSYPWFNEYKRYVDTENMKPNKAWLLELAKKNNHEQTWKEMKELQEETYLLSVTLISDNTSAEITDSLYTIYRLEKESKRRQWEITDLFMDFVKRFVKESEGKDAKKK